LAWVVYPTVKSADRQNHIENGSCLWTFLSWLCPPAKSFFFLIFLKKVIYDFELTHLVLATSRLKKGKKVKEKRRRKNREEGKSPLFATPSMVLCTEYGSLILRDSAHLACPEFFRERDMRLPP
jgi:hypothetical protein